MRILIINLDINASFIAINLSLLPLRRAVDIEDKKNKLPVRNEFMSPVACDLTVNVIVSTFLAELRYKAVIMNEKLILIIFKIS